MKPPKGVSWKRYLNSLTGTKRILGFARYLETRKHVPTDNRYVRTKQKFNMSSYNFNCGSPACMGGHAAEMSEGCFEPTVAATAAKWLGLSFDASHTLFTPSRYALTGYKLEPGSDGFFDIYNKITPKMAAQALRRYARGARTMDTIWRPVV